MKKLYILFILVALFGCNKDDNKITNSNNGTNTGTEWKLTYNKPDSTYFPGSPKYLGYSNATNLKKIWVKFSYKGDAPFSFILQSNSSDTIYRKPISIINQFTWYKCDDSTDLLVNYHEDILNYMASLSPGKFVCIKDVFVYLR
jgi:hypothetical protein